MNRPISCRSLHGFFLLVGLLCVSGTCSSFAQTKEQVKAQAESQLQQMTPDQIDAKIKELGLTREEAVKKAAEVGISLEQYLGGPKSTAPAAAPSAAPGAESKTPGSTESPIVMQPNPSPPRFVDSAGLPYFGYDIFASIPAAFEPTPVGPVDPEYVVGPGDVLRVSVWGQVEFQNELTIDNEGRIFISTVGQVLVTGMSLDQVYKKILKEMSRSYAGLVATHPTVWLDVTLAKLRPKRVFIMGEVGKPGGYTVSSYSTVFNSLYSVGGPKASGSLRDVRVVRDGKVIAHVDLYKYLVGADETDDIRVQNNDIVFIPQRGKSVAIRGAVSHPAVYELLPQENLAALMRFCGGLASTAYTYNAQIDRIKPFRARTGSIEDRMVIDFDLRQVLRQPVQDVPLFSDDVVQVFSVLDVKTNFVTVQGSVWRPGRYELGEIRTVKDLVAAAKGLQPKTFMGLAHLVRLNPDLITTRIVPLNLDSVLYMASCDVRLAPRDELMVYSTEIAEVKEKYVTITGEVKSPGRFPLRSNMTLEDLIPMAGGYTESAEVLEAEVSRILPRGFQGDSLAILLHPKLPTGFYPAGDGRGRDSMTSAILETEGKFILLHRDEVLIRPNPNYRVQQDVLLQGDFKYPGLYSLQHRGERLSELLARAGGPTITSYLGGAQLFRGDKRLLLNFDKAYYDKNPRHDVMLFGGDRILIPSRPHTVFVTGEVNKPGLLAFNDGQDVSYYIDRAGGLTDSAYYAVLEEPTGESRRVNFGFLRNNPEVLDGASIMVLRVPPPVPSEKGESLANTLKDMFAIATSAATIAFIVWQVRR